MWNDSYADECDRVVVTCLAEVSSPTSAARRLRMAAGMLRQVEMIRAERLVAVLELRDMGWTMRQIGAVIGVSPQRIADIINRRRPFPGREPTDQT